jgi:hypothetical protein
MNDHVTHGFDSMNAVIGPSMWSRVRNSKESSRCTFECEIRYGTYNEYELRTDDEDEKEKKEAEKRKKLKFLRIERDLMEACNLISPDETGEHGISIQEEPNN